MNYGFQVVTGKTAISACPEDHAISDIYALCVSHAVIRLTTCLNKNTSWIVGKESCYQSDRPGKKLGPDACKSRNSHQNTEV